MESIVSQARYWIVAAVVAVLGLTFSWALWQRSWDTMFMTGLVLVLITIPYILDSKYGIKFSSRFRFGLVLFFFATIFLGEVNHYYDTYHWWDSVLHAVAGFGVTIFGFAVLKSIYSQSQLRSVPFMTSLFAFSFSGMVLGLWEIYEFLADILQIGEGKMQPSSEDTMIDLIVGYVAAAVVCVFGYRHLRNNEKNFVASETEETKLDAIVE